MIIIHNGLNPLFIEYETISLIISLTLSICLIIYVMAQKPHKIHDMCILVFVISSYLFSAVQFLNNIHIA